MLGGGPGPFPSLLGPGEADGTPGVNGAGLSKGPFQAYEGPRLGRRHRPGTKAYLELGKSPVVGRHGQEPHGGPCTEGRSGGRCADGRAPAQHVPQTSPGLLSLC